MVDLVELEAPDAGRGRDELRTRVVSAAADLLTRGGRDALTTRAVAVAAGVQAPTIYRLFGDKSGLLDAVAEYGFAAYLAQKTDRRPGPDPVEALRAGWQLHVGFGLANPAIYALMYGDPQPGVLTPAAAAGHRVLQEHIHRIAVAGRLRVSEDIAVGLVHAAGSGSVFTLLALPEEQRDLTLSALALEAVIDAITTDTPTVADPSPASAAVALRAVLPTDTVLSDAEHRLLTEWLDRLAAAPVFSSEPDGPPGPVDPQPTR